MSVEATISGCVYEGDGSTPIPSARLIGHPSAGGQMRFGTAGPDGCYVVGGFTSGDYLIYAFAPGRQTLYYEQALAWGEATVLHLVSGQDTPDIDFSLPLAGSISGTILRANGSVISDQRIVVDAVGTTPDTSLVRGEVSRQDGTYTVDGLVPGIYKVSVSVMYAPGLVGEYYPNKRLLSEAQTMVVRVGENVPGINFNLEQDAPITGRLLDPVSGQPVNVNNAHVTAYDLNRNFRSDGLVLPNGTFQINGLEPGSYKLVYNVPGYARLFYNGTLDPAGATVVTTTTQGEAVDLGDIQLTAGITLTGHIYAEDGTTTISGAAVSVRAAGTGQIEIISPTGPDGAYSVPGLAVGDYVMRISAMGYETQFYQNGDSWDTAVPFAIANASPEAKDFSLIPGGVISGTVLAGNGLPVYDATINVKAIGITPGANEIEAVVGSDGKYTLSGLRPGSYHILANSRYAAAYSAVYYDGQPLQADGSTFVIGAGSMSHSGVDFQLIRTAYTFTDETSGTTLTYTDKANPDFRTTVDISQDSVDEPTLFVYTPTDLSETQAGFQFAGVGFTINAYQNETYLEEFQFGQPTRVELRYDPTALGEMAEENLRLLYFNQATQEWEDAACGDYERYPADDRLVVPICHLSDFGVFDYSFEVYLPIIQFAR